MTKLETDLPAVCSHCRAHVPEDMEECPFRPGFCPHKELPPPGECKPNERDLVAYTLRETAQMMQSLADMIDGPDIDGDAVASSASHVLSQTHLAAHTLQQHAWQAAVRYLHEHGQMPPMNKP